MQASSAKLSLYPLLWLSASFACGIAVGNFLDLRLEVLLAACLIFAACAAATINKRSAPLFLVLAFLAAGAFCLESQQQSISLNRIKRIYDDGRIVSGEPVEIEGVLVSKPEPAHEGVFLTLDARTIRHRSSALTVSGRVRLFASITESSVAGEYEQLALGHGSRIRVACSLVREERYLNPGVMSRIEILDQQGIDATGIIKSPLLVEKRGDETVFLPLAWVYERRQDLIAEFSEKFSGSAGGILIASLLGDKHFLDRGTAELFREGGTFHILVISGLHITFIGGLTLLFVRYFTKKRLWQFVFAVSFLWAYTLAVGADVPVVRASIMFTALLLSQVINRTGTLLNALGACALILLVWRPSDLFSASFQLTFASVAAIVAMAFPVIETLRRIGAWTPTTETPYPANVPKWITRFCEALYWKENIWKIDSGRNIWSARLFKAPYLRARKAPYLRSVAAYIFEGILVSLIVQIWLLPFLVVYFHRISPVSLLLNLWVGFFIALESFSAVAAVFLGSFSDALALPLIVLTELLNSLLLMLPKLFLGLTWASWRVPIYSGGMRLIYIVYFVPVIVLAFAVHRWRPFDIGSQPMRGEMRAYLTAVALLAVFAMTIVFHPFSSPRADGRLSIDFLDVGQGDAALITFPTGETMLVDGGGAIRFREDDDRMGGFGPDRPRVGETVVSEFLWEKGYSHIDHIVATHADSDHIEGLVDVAKNFHVGNAMFGRIPMDDPDLAELYSVLAQRGVPISMGLKGDSFFIGEVKIEILHPSNTDVPGSVSDNNDSLVLLLTYGSKKFLLTGDIEKEAETQLLQGSISVDADLVKVPHHGSRTSSTEGMVEAVSADLAIVSVGKRSMFGHPHAEVIERWTNSGAEIRTTGERGTISVSTDGEDLVIRSFR